MHGDVLIGGGVEEARGGNQTPRTNASRAKWRKDAEGQLKGEKCLTGNIQKIIQPENTKSLPGEGICSVEKCWGLEDKHKRVGARGGKGDRKGRREKVINNWTQVERLSANTQHTHNKKILFRPLWSFLSQKGKQSS